MAATAARAAATAAATAAADALEQARRKQQARLAKMPPDQREKAMAKLADPDHADQTASAAPAQANLAPPPPPPLGRQQPLKATVYKCAE